MVYNILIENNEKGCTYGVYTGRLVCDKTGTRLTNAEMVGKFTVSEDEIIPTLEDVKIELAK